MQKHLVLSYNNLSIATMSLLDQTILSFQTRDVSEFQDFLQGMMMSEGSYAYSNQRYYLVHTYETLRLKQELNYADAYANDLSEEEIQRLVEQNQWLLQASGLVGTLAVIAITNAPKDDITHNYQDDGTLVIKNTAYTGVKLSDLRMENGKYKWGFQYQERDIITTQKSIGLLADHPEYETIDVKYGDQRASHNKVIETTIFINQEEATKGAHAFKEFEAISKKKAQLIEDQVITTINTLGYFGGPKLAIGVSLITGTYRFIKSGELKDAKGPIGTLGGELGKQFEAFENSKKMSDYAFDTYKNIDAYNKLGKEQQAVIDDFMELFYIKSHVEFDEYPDPVTGKNVSGTSVVKDVNSDIYNATNMGKLERGGLIALYGEDVRVVVEKLKSKLPEEKLKQIEVLEQKLSNKGFKFEELNFEAFVMVIPDLAEALKNAGFPTLSEKLKGGK